MGLSVSFVEKRTRRVPRLFDEEATDEPIIDAETKFHVELFFPIIDIITSKLERFKGQHFVANSFNFLSPKYLLKMTSDEIHKAAKDFIEIYQFDMCFNNEQPQDYCKDLSEEILSYRVCFQEDLIEMEDGKRIRRFLNYPSAQTLAHRITLSYSSMQPLISLYIDPAIIKTNNELISNFSNTN